MAILNSWRMLLVASISLRQAATHARLRAWLQSREAAAAGVIIFHVALIALLILGLRQDSIAPQARELTLSIAPGGLRVTGGSPPKPELSKPTLPEIAPPDIAIADPAPSITVLPSPGGPAVTVPAEAIGEFHRVPKLTPALQSIAHRDPLRLLLTIAADGSVTKAVVASSSGSTGIDALAIAWVLAHWRYRPAMQDGRAISVSTTAIVPL